MIIPRVRQVRTSEPAAFAWAGLRKFQNVDLVTDTLNSLHDVPARYRDNVKKQAEQLRYCLIQAREYFVAATTVSTATKPNLLYYGAMSLALAEILFKQSGDSSLDRARDEHKHHGLSMTVGGVPRGAHLCTSSSSLRASPVEIGGKRKGTFELWHRTSREAPVPGPLKRMYEEGTSTTSFEIIFGAIDKPYSPIPKSGFSRASSDGRTCRLSWS